MNDGQKEAHLSLEQVVKDEFMELAKKEDRTMRSMFKVMMKKYKEVTEGK